MKDGAISSLDQAHGINLRYYNTACLLLNFYGHFKFLENELKALSI